MIQSPGTDDVRTLRTSSLAADLAIVGGGMAGVCGAVTAARAGAKVVLVQDRPVLGGNASSEVRLWILGATSHMGNNNRWAREGGVVDEILVENLYRNPEGNPLILDTILLEKVVDEPNITLLLNTAVTRWKNRTRTTISAVARVLQPEPARVRYRGRRCSATPRATASSASWPERPFAWAPRASHEFGEGFARSDELRRTAGPLDLLLHARTPGRPVKFVAPIVRAERHHADPALPRFQGDRFRLPLLVDRVGRPAGHRPRDRDDQVGAVEGRLRRLGLHQELRQVPRGGKPDAGMGRARSPASARAAASKATTS